MKLPKKIGWKHFAIAAGVVYLLGKLDVWNTERRANAQAANANLNIVPATGSASNGGSGASGFVDPEMFGVDDMPIDSVERAY